VRIKRACGASLLVLGGLAACSTPLAPRYHTLMAPPSEAASSATAPPLSAAWELIPVGLPPQVRQPQMVVRAPDGTMAVLEQERWVAPLASEFRAALADRLARRLGSADGVRLPSQLHKKAWRVQVDVRRFDAAPGRYTQLEATWVLRPGEGDAALACRTAVEEQVGEGYPAVSEGHRKALVRLADDIAATLRRFDAEGRAACPPG
jgi:uncharacterized lipoprotein YmbA